MAKPKKYPRKLRHTLEKVAEKRDARAEEKEQLEKFGNPFVTLWHTFLLRKSVDTMKIDFEKIVRNERIEMTHVMRQPRHKLIKTIYPRPPWLRDLPPVE